MNSYIFLHRIRGPVIIVVFGITALLDQWHILSYGESWPLYLIVLGLLQLAERAVWSSAQNPPPPAGYPGYNTPGWGSQPAPPPTTTALTIPHDEERK